jgi:hypothetical protein
MIATLFYVLSTDRVDLARSQVRYRTSGELPMNTEDEFRDAAIRRSKRCSGNEAPPPTHLHARAAGGRFVCRSAVTLRLLAHAPGASRANEVAAFFLSA